MAKAAANAATSGFGAAKGINHTRSNYEFGGIGGNAVTRSQMGAITKIQKKGRVNDPSSNFDKKYRTEIGSYTNLHESGITYSDKGTRERSQISGRREARRNNDPHVATDFSPANNSREAFKQESVRIDKEGVQKVWVITIKFNLQERNIANRTVNYEIRFSRNKTSFNTI